MRTLTRIAMLAAILLIAAPASAQRIATIGKEIPDVKWPRTGGERDGRNEEGDFWLFRSLRGSVAVFYYWRSSNLHSVEVLTEIKDLHQQFRNRGVRFVSITVDEEDQAERILTEKEAEFFRHYFFKSPGAYYHLGALSDPYVALVDPRGVLAWRGVPDNRLEQRLADLVERTKPPLGDQRWLDQRYRKAERFLNQGDYGRAYTVARDLFRMTDDSHAEHSKSEALMPRCVEAAERGLTEVIQAEREGDLKKAARIVAQIAVRFHDPDEAEGEDRNRPGQGQGQGPGQRNRQNESINRRAELEIGRMNGNRELKALIREARNNAEGELQIDYAKDYEEDDFYLEAKRIYEEVVEDFKDTDAAKEAKQRLRRIEQDEKIREKIAQRRARDQAVRWLDIGERFAALKMYDEARERFERVIAEHPDTVAAERAKVLLADLPKSKAGKSAGDSKEPETAQKP